MFEYMIRFILVASAFFFASMANLRAQTLPIDFNSSLDNFTGFGGLTFAKTTDPLDASNQVGEFRNQGGDPWEGGFIDPNSSMDIDVYPNYTMRFYSPDANQHTVTLKLENGSNPNEERSQSVTSMGWNSLSFDFTAAAGNYGRLTLFVDGGSASTGTFLFDDIHNGSSDSVALDTIYTQLVWADEFDYFGPVKPDNWFSETVPPQNGNWFNGEVQHYTDRTDNAVSANGMLTITAKKETYDFQGNVKNYTSARLNSMFSFTYGRVDVLAKLPEGDGTWPAIWMLGNSIGNSQYPATNPWPYCGEIDIMEHWGNNPNVIHGSLHTGSSSGATVNTGSMLASDVSNEFHLYSMNWSPNEISFLVDSELYYTYNPSVKNPDTWPFDDPQFILLNIAMGGVGGNIDPNTTESSMVIDYVRVYQGPGADTTVKVSVYDQLEEETQFRISPNPNQGDFELAFEDIEGSLQLSILNVKGQVLERREITQKDKQRFSLDLPAGVYFIEATDEIGKAYKERLVISE